MAVEVYESGTPEENVPAPRRGRPGLPGEADEEVIGDPEPGRGPLLDLPPRKAAELAARLYFGQDEHLSRKIRSEEHTSELQSRENLVCRLLLEKKKKY